MKSNKVVIDESEGQNEGRVVEPTNSNFHMLIFNLIAEILSQIDMVTVLFVIYLPLG
jgi:hypothetical protein